MSNKLEEELAAHNDFIRSHIRQLQAENAVLKAEVERLRAALSGGKQIAIRALPIKADA
jgi:regulator of replication initiation timing